jgi:hypothetical protein
MKFGQIKSLIETKLTNSFQNKTLKEDISYFKKNILNDNSVKQLMYGYDKLTESTGCSKEAAEFIVDELYSELKRIKISESTMFKINKWTKGVESDNKYEIIDNLIFSTIDEAEKKISSKKVIIENLTNKQIKKESVKLPISTLVKVANKNIQSHLSNLTESERESVLKVLKSDEKTIEEFNKLKENTINKLDKLMSESDESLKNTLTETKEKILSSEFSKQEYIKLISLNKGLN